ncbi:MAG: hypothetical protein M3O62_11480 [Pseudomonadota bacterium]|nr:hypothetical protein [Pseudomonadota bacterium]
MDVVGLKTVFDILNHLGRTNGDEQMLRNAGWIKAHLLDQGKLGLQTGEGYYRYRIQLISTPILCRSRTPAA